MPKDKKTYKTIRMEVPVPLGMYCQKYRDEGAPTGTCLWLHRVHFVQCCKLDFGAIESNSKGYLKPVTCRNKKGV